MKNSAVLTSVALLAVLFFAGCGLKSQGESFEQVGIKDDAAKGKTYILTMVFERATTDSNDKAYIRAYEKDKKLGQFYYPEKLAKKVATLQKDKKYNFKFTVTSVFMDVSPVDGTLLEVGEAPEK